MHSTQGGEPDLNQNHTVHGVRRTERGLEEGCDSQVRAQAPHFPHRQARYGSCRAKRMHLRQCAFSLQIPCVPAESAHATLCARARLQAPVSPRAPPDSSAASLRSMPRPSMPLLLTAQNSGLLCVSCLSPCMGWAGVAQVQGVVWRLPSSLFAACPLFAHYLHFYVRLCLFALCSGLCVCVCVCVCVLLQDR